MSSRYYEASTKEDDIKPGKISAELRAALNIAENDLPVWIYRMRALGYPPGWLNKAIVDTNDIFDTDSQNDQDSNKRKNPSEEVQYDHSKLIEYPGFNAPLPPNTNDYHYYYNMPPMLAHQQLDYAKQHMSAFRPAPLPKRIRVSPTANDESLVKGKKDTSESSNDCEGPASPDEENESSSGESKEEKLIDKNMNESANRSNLSSSLTDEIKLVSKGSPMPKPVSRLPLERFSEGVVGELLYFENTPNSSGKFDSIRGLLNTIRQSKSEADTSFESVKKDSTE